MNNNREENERNPGFWGERVSRRVDGTGKKDRRLVERDERYVRISTIYVIVNT